MIQELNLNFRISTQTAWVVGVVGGGISLEPARIEDVLFVKRNGADALAYKVQYQNGQIGYVFLDEKEAFEVVSFGQIVAIP